MQMWNSAPINRHNIIWKYLHHLLTGNLLTSENWFDCYQMANQSRIAGTARTRITAARNWFFAQIIQSDSIGWSFVIIREASFIPAGKVCVMFIVEEIEFVTISKVSLNLNKRVLIRQFYSVQFTPRQEPIEIRRVKRNESVVTPCNSWPELTRWFPFLCHFIEDPPQPAEYHLAGPHTGDITEILHLVRRDFMFN